MLSAAASKERDRTQRQISTCYCWPNLGSVISPANIYENLKKHSTQKSSRQNLGGRLLSLSSSIRGSRDHLILATMAGLKSCYSLPWSQVTRRRSGIWSGLLLSQSIPVATTPPRLTLGRVDSWNERMWKMSFDCMRTSMVSALTSLTCFLIRFLVQACTASWYIAWAKQAAYYWYLLRSGQHTQRCYSISH